LIAYSLSKVNRKSTD